jgi:hypothetical protein
MRMKIWLLTVGLVVTGIVNATEGPSVEYTAESYLETAYGVQQGPVYFAPGKERREFNMDGIRMVNIIRRDRNVIWSLMPEDKMYMEMKPSKENSAGDLGGYQIEQTMIGPETLDGVQTTKSKIIMTGPDGEKMGGFMWITAEGIVVKMDAIAMDKKSKARIKTELKNLVVGDVDDSLFEIPEDYTKMDMMGGIGNMMAGDAGGEDDDAGDGGDETNPKEKKRGFGWKDAIDLIK